MVEGLDLIARKKNTFVTITLRASGGKCSLGISVLVLLHGPHKNTLSKIGYFYVVGVKGLEPLTSSTSMKRSSQLSYTPTLINRLQHTKIMKNSNIPWACHATTAWVARACV
jgi:hypothetical protein